MSETISKTAIAFRVMRATAETLENAIFLRRMADSLRGDHSEFHAYRRESAERKRRNQEIANFESRFQDWDIAIF